MKYSIHKIYKYLTNRKLNFNYKFYRKNKILPYIETNRTKFLFKIHNAWIIYLHKKQVPNIYKIKEMLENYLEIFNLDTIHFNLQKRIYIIEFINDLKKNNMIIKSLKESGKYLVYKQQYDIPRLYKPIDNYIQ